MGTAYHAMARSAIFASRARIGLTTPGLMKVPTPGCEASSGRNRNFNRDGSKSLHSSETDLVINNLFERTTLV